MIPQDDQQFLRDLWRAQMLDVAEALQGMKREPYVQNQFVILPEERISLTISREEFDKLTEEVEQQEHASSEIGKKLLEDIDAIITGESLAE